MDNSAQLVYNHFQTKEFVVPSPVSSQNLKLSTNGLELAIDCGSGSISCHPIIAKGFEQNYSYLFTKEGSDLLGYMPRLIVNRHEEIVYARGSFEMKKHTLGVCCSPSCEQESRVIIVKGIEKTLDEVYNAGLEYSGILRKDEFKKLAENKGLLNDFFRSKYAEQEAFLGLPEKNPRVDDLWKRIKILERCR